MGTHRRALMRNIHAQKHAQESSPVLGRGWEPSGSTGGWREGEDLLKEEA